MNNTKIPDTIVRFLLTSIDSIPHLEALLLVRQHFDFEWDADLLAHSLYIQPKVAEELLTKLRDSGFLTILENTTQIRYKYTYPSLQTRQTIEEISDYYSKNLILITNLIHNKSAKAQQFADAFRLRTED